jgi:hypothetical protein
MNKTEKSCFNNCKVVSLLQKITNILLINASLAADLTLLKCKMLIAIFFCRNYRFAWNNTFEDYGIESYTRSKESKSLYISKADDIANEVGTENSKRYRSCPVINTPSIIITGSLLPRQLEIYDIKYFMEVFSRKEKIVFGNN